MRSIYRPLSPPTLPTPHPPAAILATVPIVSRQTYTSHTHQISWKHEARGEEFGLAERRRGCRAPVDAPPPGGPIAASR